LLNKSQWKSIWFLTIITSALLSIVILRNSYNENEDAFISVIYAIIPIIVIIGTTYTLYLKGNDPIAVLPFYKKFLTIVKNFFKWILRIMTIATICIAIGFGSKIPIEIGQIIYNKYSFNENLYKSKYAIDRTRSEEWGLKNIEFLKSDISIILEDKECKLIYEDTINYKSDLPLESAYLRLVACDKSKKDTLYDKVLEINAKFETVKKKQVSLILPEDFFKLYLLNLRPRDTNPNYESNINELLKRGNSAGQITYKLYKKGFNLEGNQMAIEFHPYGGKISTEYIEKISRSNLKSMLE